MFDSHQNLRCLTVFTARQYYNEAHIFDALWFVFTVSIDNSISMVTVITHLLHQYHFSLPTYPAMIEDSVCFITTHPITSPCYVHNTKFGPPVADTLVTFSRIHKMVPNHNGGPWALFLLKEIRFTSIKFETWISNYIPRLMCAVATHPWSNFKWCLHKPLLMLCMAE